MTHVVLLAGPSGSGKSRLVRTSGLPCLRLDDFYADADAPGLPRTLGIVDWDDPASWDGAAAVAALVALVGNGQSEVPVYSIPESRRVGSRTVHLPPGSATLLAEGIFAIEALPLALAAGLDASGIYLDRPRSVVAFWRLVRDLRQQRKAVSILIRRGFALWRAQPTLKRRALAAGFRAYGWGEATRLLTARSSVGEAPAADPH